jgi:hypothetical protein
LRLSFPIGGLFDEAWILSLMSVVYNSVRGKEMVVKIVNLPPDYTQEEMMVLVMEAAFMRRLSKHPNIGNHIIIVHILGVGWLID